MTPAQYWTAREKSAPAPADAHAHPPKRMPLLQYVTMFISVYGPIAGLCFAIVKLWHAGPISVGWSEIIVMLGMYALAGYGVTIGFHRLFTHKSFETSRPLRLFLAICGSIAAQGALIRWTATHRRHHQMSDDDGDPHSPHAFGEGSLAMIRGMWHAHMGWLFYRDPINTANSVDDLMSDKALILIDKLYFFWVFFGIALPGTILGLWTGTWQGFASGAIWGGLVRICLMQHVTWSINSVCHVWGGRPFQTSDYSANNLIFGIFALGEGWHNNHHAFPTSARHGLFWWQFDSSWIIIRAMQSVGLVKNVRTPTPAAMQIKRVPE